MSATPKLRSGAFPRTPATAAASRGAPPTPSPSPSLSPPPSPSSGRAPARSSPLPVAPHHGGPAPANGRPLIPVTVLDAPTQRIYILSIYVALVGWRLWDWVYMAGDDTAESFWLFTKWATIDFVFLFGLPELRIPWLELAQPLVVALFLGHVAFDWMLMFNIPVPVISWLLGLIKVYFEREISVSEHSVKTYNILHNASLIKGRQVINILPEGSARLNPRGFPFCLGGDAKAATIPLYFNATVPMHVEVIRTDLDSHEEEVLKLSRSNLREIERLTRRLSPEGIPVAVQFDYTVKKTGAYRLGRVLDEYKLEVQRPGPYTFIVSCPSASIVSQSADRCLGDLSDLSLRVEGTPPLKIRYSRSINGRDHGVQSFQDLQPAEFSSPLVGSLVPVVPDNGDISWARPAAVTVNLNDSMNVGGDWQYSIEEVHDAFGNVAKYVSPVDDPDLVTKPKHLVQNLHVQERPKIKLDGCDMRNPLKVAKGKKTKLPIEFDLARRSADDTAHSLTWLFSPVDSLTSSGEHGDDVTVGSYSAKHAKDRPTISAPGLYTLKSVSSGPCEGEVQEPSSCLLLNPLEPRLALRSEEIPDNCAGHSVGLRVDLDLVGTPPFVVHYDVVTNGHTIKQKVNVHGMRYQMELIPRIAGEHEYIFRMVDDAIYTRQPLTGPEMSLRQSVKPAARATIVRPSGLVNACLQEQISVECNLLGDPPFTLEYELFVDGKRDRFKASDIHVHSYTIETPVLSQGGEYTLALTNVQDSSGCRNSLQDELKISVRRSPPRAAFGLMDSKRHITVVEGAKARLPLRLQGDGPWKLHYRRDQGDSKEIEQIFRQGNDILEVTNRGTYELIDVADDKCHGVIDPAASRFEVDWFPRPEVKVVETDSISRRADLFVKQDVCEGDVDSFEVILEGAPPFRSDYEIRHRAPQGGSGSVAKRSFEVVGSRATIQMDTAKAGVRTYRFSVISDNLYNNYKRKEPLIVEQTVHAKPSATFDRPGQSSKYCKSEQDGEEEIPITLSGEAPFSMEIEIKHQSGAMPQTFRVPSIDKHSYGLQIPREYLRLGSQQVRIRKVRDARGCQRKMEVGGPSVQVQLYDAPAMYPLESRTDYCVGERIAYTLSGTPPFEVWYTFDGAERKAKSPTTNFRRVAETPGDFVITSISDKASECRAAVNITRAIHPMPSVRISRGRNAHADIHEGGEVEILFEFGGTPPFEFTYTRSTNARKGARSHVLETRHDTSHEHSKVIRTSQEGTYEVVAIKDQFCAFSTQQIEAKEGQKMLT